MFKHQGPARSARKNAVLASFLAATAGFVNSAGFLQIGSFTSHVTGNVGSFGLALATHGIDAAIAPLVLVGMFFLGAFLSSLIVESSFFRQTGRAYAAALFVEGALLVAYDYSHALNVGTACLCLAMGMQNSLVTQLSGAVVRTTHLTGVVTDLGIEVARWLRWQRAKLSRALIGARDERNPPQKPSISRFLLLSSILIAFACGAVGGALGAVRLGRTAMLVPAAAIFFASAYALIESRHSPTAS